jgi:hypothetical protein
MIRIVLAALGLAALAACAQPAPAPAPEAAFREQTIRATATVVALDRADRDIVLRLENGEILGAKLGPEVRRLDEIGVGDTVIVEYYRSIAARMATVADDAPLGAVVAGRAPADQAPGVAVASSIEETVEVVSYDPVTAEAVVRDADGELLRFIVHPDMRDFAVRRAPGDRIRVLFTEAVAVGIAPRG